MGLDKDIQDAFKQFRKSDATVFSAQVTAVSETKKTVDVKDVEGFEFKDVRLAAAEDDKKSVIIIPKLNSSVLVCMIGDDLNTLFVTKTNEVEKVDGVIENVKFTIDPSGYKLTRNDENLKDILNDMIDELNKIKVIQGRTIDVAAMTAIKQRLNQVLI